MSTRSPLIGDHACQPISTFIFRHLIKHIYMHVYAILHPCMKALSYTAYLYVNMTNVLATVNSSVWYLGSILRSGPVPRIDPPMPPPPPAAGNPTLTIFPTRGNQWPHRGDIYRIFFEVMLYSLKRNQSKNCN
jgi:hypothetical protein